MNTSFNKQEPLVENPEEALNTFFYMNGVNKLFMGNFIINKKNLRPRIISLQEKIYENKISHDIFKKILKKFPNCHKIIIGNNEKEISIPLVKDIFSGHLKEDVLTLIAKLINNFSIKNDFQELKIKSTSKKMQEIIFSNISKKINEVYKERDYKIYNDL